MFDTDELLENLNEANSAEEFNDALHDLTESMPDQPMSLSELDLVKDAVTLAIVRMSDDQSRLNNFLNSALYYAKQNQNVGKVMMSSFVTASVYFSKEPEKAKKLHDHGQALLAATAEGEMSRIDSKFPPSGPTMH